MEPFVWLEVHSHERDVWKFVSMASGAQYVMTIGEPVMLMWLVGNLDMVEQVTISILIVTNIVHMPLQFQCCSKCFILLI